MTQRGIAELRRITQWFINDDPSSIVLTPHTKSPDGAGGYTWTAGTPRDAQTFKVIASPGNLDGSTITEGGTSKSWAYVLLGPYDAAVEIGDTWSEGSNTYRVTALMQKNDYEKRAVVLAFGTEPNYG